MSLILDIFFIFEPITSDCVVILVDPHEMQKGRVCDPLTPGSMCHQYRTLLIETYLVWHYFFMVSQFHLDI